MKKTTTLSMVLGKQIHVLTAKQMAVIKGGVDSTADALAVLTATAAAAAAAAVGPLSATDDEKRRERPGGGISTH